MNKQTTSKLALSSHHPQPPHGPRPSKTPYDQRYCFHDTVMTWKRDDTFLLFQPQAMQSNQTELTVPSVYPSCHPQVYWRVQCGRNRGWDSDLPHEERHQKKHGSMWTLPLSRCPTPLLQSFLHSPSTRPSWATPPSSKNCTLVTERRSSYPTVPSKGWWGIVLG